MYIKNIGCILKIVILTAIDDQFIATTPASETRQYLIT